MNTFLKALDLFDAERNELAMVAKLVTMMNISIIAFLVVGGFTTLISTAYLIHRVVKVNFKILFIRAYLFF